MDLFTEKLPDSIEIGGEKFSIKTDFSVWIKFEKLLSDNEISPYERFFSAVELCFDFGGKKQFPKDAALTLKALLDFYSCQKKSKNEVEKSAPLYDFTVDSAYIYAAFLSDYGIDLTACKLHWWKFCALFSSLKEDNRICEIMRIRGTDLSEIKDLEQRNRMRKLKKIYRLSKNVEIDVGNEIYKAFL